MKKKLISSLVLVTLLISFMPIITKAEINDSGICGDNVTWSIDSDGTLTISGIGNMMDYDKNADIPWYDYREDISLVVIEDGVTSIGKYAFASCSMSDIIIPDSVTNIGYYAFQSASNLKEVNISQYVTNIGNYVFVDTTSLENINVNEENTTYESINGVLISISDEQLLAYPSAKADTSYTVPENVKTIGVQSFYRAKNLQSIALSNVTRLRNYAFVDCTGIASIVVPESVTTLNNGVFGRCVNLDTITFMNAETTFGTSVFDGCSRGLVIIGHEGSTAEAYALDNYIYFETISKIPTEPDIAWTYDDGVLTISGVGDMDDYFNDAPWDEYKRDITRVIITEGVTKIGSFAFYQCENIQYIEIPTTVNNIGSYAFSYCTSLERIVIPSGATYLDNGLFQACTSLKSVTIPDSVYGIGQWVFSGCRNLSDINISKYVTRISADAFVSCNNLNINVDSDNETFCDIDGVLYNKDKSILLAYAKDNIQSFYKVPDTVTIIGENAFSGCSFLDEIELPKGLMEIRRSAFSGTGMKNITIPNTVTKLGSWVFESAALEHIKIPNNITSIEDGVFYRCSNLTAISLPDGITTIGNQAFYRCDTLLFIDIPKSIISIGKNAFDECSNLSDVYYFGTSEEWESADISENGNDYLVNADIHYVNAENNNTLKWDITGNILTINGEGNMSCWSYSVPWDLYIDDITSVIIKDGITSIDDRIFFECSSLKDIQIPDSVTYIGDYAFYGCSSLTDIQLPDNVTNIGKHAFHQCSTMKNVNIPKEVTSISKYTFFDCASLTELNFPEKVSSIEYMAFAYCNSLKNIYVSENITSIDEYAFHSCSSLRNVYYGGSAESWSGIVNSSNSYELRRARLVNTSGKCGENVTWKLEGGTLIISGEGDMWDFVSDPYIEIPWEASILDISSVTIEDGVTSIGSYAFYNCSSLSTLQISDSVTSIGEDAFFGCTALADIEIPDRVTSIGTSAFYGCSSLTNINLPSSLQSISGYLFYRCESLSNIDIPNGVTSIGNVAFNKCLSLKTVIIPESVTSIDYYAFDGCSSLSDIYFMGTKESWDAMFYLITASVVAAEIHFNHGTCGYDLTWTLDDEGTLTISGDGEMSNWRSIHISNTSSNPENNIERTYQSTVPWYGSRNDIKLAVLGEGLTHIGNRAFYDCTTLADIEIPASVISIGSESFVNCTSLKEITIPYQVISIGADVFEGCSEELTIKGYIGSQAEKYADENNITFVSLGNMPRTIIASGKCGSNVIWTLDNYATLTISGEGAMYDYDDSWERYTRSVDSLSVVIDDGVTYIGEGVFANTYNIKEVIISGSVASIGGGAFYNCYNLKNIIIPESVTLIGQQAFGSCNNLTDIIVNEENGSYCSIDGNLFSKDKTELVQYATGKPEDQYVIPDSVTVIGNSAFAECKHLKNITIPESVTEIKDNAFNGCSELIDIKVPNGITSISNYLFGYCTSLKRINIPDGVTYIGDAAFANCTELTSITIPDKVTDIGNYAFINSGLTSVTIPDSVTYIGYEAFRNCIDLTEIIIPYHTIHIGNNNFNGCSEVFTIRGYSDSQAEKYANANDLAFISIGDTPQEVVLSGKYGDNIIWTLDTYCKLSLSGEGDMDSGSMPWWKYEEDIATLFIEDGITCINDWAFSYFYNMESVVIPRSITKIGEFAFNSCMNLRDIYYTGTEEHWNSIAIEDNNGYIDEAVVHYNYQNSEVEEVRKINPIGAYSDKVEIEKTIENDLVIFTITPLEEIDLSPLQLFVAEYTDDGILNSVTTGKNTGLYNKIIITVDIPKQPNFKFLLWDINQTPLISSLTEIR